MLYGGSAFLSYQLVFDILRHHDHTNLRPMFIDHEIAMALIGGVSGALIGGGLTRHFAAGAAFSVFHLGPMLWWFKMNGRQNNSTRPSNVFYENTATKEEIARFQAQD